MFFFGNSSLGVWKIFIIRYIEVCAIDENWKLKDFKIWPLSIFRCRELWIFFKNVFYEKFFFWYFEVSKSWNGWRPFCYVHFFWKRRKKICNFLKTYFESSFSAEMKKPNVWSCVDIFLVFIFIQNEET